MGRREGGKSSLQGPHSMQVPNSTWRSKDVNNNKNACTSKECVLSIHPQGGQSSAEAGQEEAKKTHSAPSGDRRDTGGQ